MPRLICIGDDEFNSNTKQGVHVVLFVMKACCLCKPVESKLADMQSIFPNIQFWRMNADNDPNTAKRLNVRAVPTIVVIKDGEEVGRIIDNNPDNLSVMLTNLIKDKAA